MSDVVNRGTEPFDDNADTVYVAMGKINEKFGHVDDALGGKVENDDPRLSDAREPTEHGNEKHSTNYEPELNTDQKRKITYGTSNPAGGSDGDIYLQYED